MRTDDNWTDDLGTDDMQVEIRQRIEVCVRERERDSEETRQRLKHREFEGKKSRLESVTQLSPRHQTLPFVFVVVFVFSLHRIFCQKSKTLAKTFPQAHHPLSISSLSNVAFAMSALVPELLSGILAMSASLPESLSGMVAMSPPSPSMPALEGAQTSLDHGSDLDSDSEEVASDELLSEPPSPSMPALEALAGAQTWLDHGSDSDSESPFSSAFFFDFPEHAHSRAVEVKAPIEPLSMKPLSIKPLSIKPLSSETGGYSTNLFISEVTPALICSVCLSVVKRPATLNCAHLFCRSCVNKLHHAKCPTCRTEFGTSSKGTNHFVQQTIVNLPIRCATHESGCKWTGTLGTNDRVYEEHRQKCQFTQSACPICSVLVCNKDMKAHQQVCPNGKYSKDVLECEIVYVPESESLMFFVWCCRCSSHGVV